MKQIAGGCLPLQHTHYKYFGNQYMFMVKEATRLKVLRASAIAYELGLHNTSERLQRLPEKIRRFKAITDPDRRLTQARWLSLEAESAEKVFREDMSEKQGMIEQIGGSCENTASAIKARSVGLALVDLSFVSMIAYCITTGAMTVGNATNLLFAAVLINMSFVFSALRIKSQMGLLKDGPKKIEEGIKELKEEVCAIIGDRA